MPAEGGAGSLLRSLTTLVVIIVVFFVVLPRVADMRSVWAIVQQMTWLEIASLVGAAMANLFTYFVLMVVAVPGLRLWQAALATEASTAYANMLPAGPAFGTAIAYGMFASWGLSRSKIASGLAVSGLADLFAKLVLPVVALAGMLLFDEVGRPLVVVALSGMAVLGAAIVSLWFVLRSEPAARRVAVTANRILTLGRGTPSSWERAIVTMRGEVSGLLRARWPALAGLSIVSHLALWLVLLAALRHVGVSDQEVSWAAALGGFAFARFLTAIPITPGGLGVLDLGLTAALVLAGGPRDEVVAAVLVFRALTYLVQIPIGITCHEYWRHSTRWWTAAA